MFTRSIIFSEFPQITINGNSLWYLVQNLAPLLRLHDALSHVDRDVTADFRKRFSLIQNSSNNMQHNLLQVSVNHNNQQYHLFCNIDLD